MRQLLQRYGIVINGDHLTVQSEVGTQRLSHMLGVVITVDYRNTGGFDIIGSGRTKLEKKNSSKKDTKS